MNIKEISLLSAEEYEECKDIIPKKNCRWWLRSDGKYHSHSEIVDYMGDVIITDVDDTNVGVAPLLICDFNENLPIGSKVEFAGQKWTVIRNGKLLCDGIIGKSPFNLNKQTDYEKSTVNKFNMIWLTYHLGGSIDFNDLLCDENMQELAYWIVSNNLSDFLARLIETLKDRLGKATKED